MTIMDAFEKNGGIFCPDRIYGFRILFEFDEIQLSFSQNNAIIQLFSGKIKDAVFFQINYKLRISA